MRRPQAPVSVGVAPAYIRPTCSGTSLQRRGVGSSLTARPRRRLDRGCRPSRPRPARRADSAAETSPPSLRRRVRPACQAARPRHRLRWTARGRDRAGEGVGSRSRTSCTHPPPRNGPPASLIMRAGPDVGDSSMDELDLKDPVALAVLAGAGARRARSAARRRHVLVAPSAPLVRPGLGRSRGRVKTRHARAAFYNMTNRMATAVEMMPNAEYHAANR